MVANTEAGRANKKQRNNKGRTCFTSVQYINKNIYNDDMPEQTQPTHSDLASEINRLNGVINKIYGRSSWGYSFMNGLFSGLGYVVGASIVFSIIIFLLGKINLVPIIGEWLGAVLNQAISSMTVRR